MPKQILVVDDNKDIVEAVTSRLEHNGYAVITADNGEAGVQLARVRKPDLIIMDVMMPKMQGGEAVKRLLEDNTTMHIPIMFLTVLTSGMSKKAKEGKININGRFFRAVNKPFDPLVLMAAVDELIGNHHSVP